MKKRHSLHACLALYFILSLTGGVQAQEVRGYAEVQAELQRVPPSGRVRIIAEIAVDPTLVTALGRKSAVNRSTENALAAIAQIGIPIVEPIQGTARVVMEIDGNELARLNQLEVITSYEIDRLNRPFR